MDRFISSMPVIQDADLSICQQHGIAYQRDREHIICYDEPYYAKCASYEDQEISRKLNAGRVALVQRHFGAGPAVDIGIGSGEFIKKRGNTWGRDVNPVAMEWLKRNDLWAQHLSDFCCFTFWDVIEHIETPESVLQHIPIHGRAFFSIPIFDDLLRVRESKHYRPGEHLQYFTSRGFIHWMVLHGFVLLESSDFETKAGRESIMSYAFTRIRRPK